VTINTLFYGDCLDVMRQIPSGSVDLIYLDPPFNSNRGYNAIYKTETGRELPDQVEAFCDVWVWDAQKEYDYNNFRSTNETEIKMRKVIEFFYDFLRQRDSKMLAYLFYMGQRLAVMHNLLKPTGSLYHHCDPTTSHYAKVLLDAIFGSENCRNEMIWYYTNASRGKKNLAKAHDVIFWYSKNEKQYVFNRNSILSPYASNMTKWRYTKGGQKGKPMPEGKTPDDVYTLPALNANDKKERMGYPTQKPLELLDRIIKTSSNKGDWVLDPFCGCATTLEAAERLGRKWIGIDIAIHAIKRVARVRLYERCQLIEGEDFVIKGVPRNMEGAKELFDRDKYQFQKWAIEQVGGFVTANKTADRGIDGRLYFRVKDKSGDLSSMVLEVKGGANVNINVVRDLRGVMERESDSVMAGLIVMEDLSDIKRANFMTEMATAGKLKGSRQKPYDTMQLLTVREIFQGKTFDTPAVEGKKESGQVVIPFSKK